MSQEKPSTSDQEREPKDVSKKESSDVAKPSGVIDGRVFEADTEIPLSEEEKAELREFKITLKKYNDLAKKIRMDAIKQEKAELIKSEKSPLNKYYEGTKQERLKVLDEEREVMEKMSKQAKAHKQ